MSSSATSPGLRFTCSSCKTSLVVTVSQAGISGPCPKCSAWIDASQFVRPTEAHSQAQSMNLPSRSGTARRRSQSVTSGKGRIRADGYLDQEFNDRRDLFATLRIIAISLSVLAVILFVMLYIKDWMSK